MHYSVRGVQLLIMCPSRCVSKLAFLQYCLSAELLHAIRQAAIYRGVIWRVLSARVWTACCSPFPVRCDSFLPLQGAPQVQYFSKGASSGAKIFSVINRKPGIDAECAGLEPEKVEGSLRLEDVSFAYPARPDVMVMKGLSLEVPAGRF